MPSKTKNYQPVYHVYLKGMSRAIKIAVWPPEQWSGNEDSRRTGGLFLEFTKLSWALGWARELRAHTIRIV